MTSSLSTANSSTVNRTTLLQSIHAMEPKEHITIGTILRKYHQVKLNENKGGIVINMATIPDEALEEIQKFVEYIHDQQKVLAKIENETNTYKQFFQ
jgi:hypothetical protein